MSSEETERDQTLLNLPGVVVGRQQLGRRRLRHGHVRGLEVTERDRQLSGKAREDAEDSSAVDQQLDLRRALQAGQRAHELRQPRQEAPRIES